MIGWFLAKNVGILLGLLYPAYQTFKVIDKKDKEGKGRMLRYWAVFATFSSVEFYTDMLISWLPFYYEIKMIVLLYLSIPFTSGSNTLYEMHMKPWLRNHQSEIDDVILQCKSSIYSSICSTRDRAVSLIHNMIISFLTHKLPAFLPLYQMFVVLVAETWNNFMNSQQSSIIDTPSNQEAPKSDSIHVVDSPNPSIVKQSAIEILETNGITNQNDPINTILDTEMEKHSSIENDAASQISPVTSLMNMKASSSASVISPQHFNAISSISSSITTVSSRYRRAATNACDSKPAESRTGSENTGKSINSNNNTNNKKGKNMSKGTVIPPRPVLNGSNGDSKKPGKSDDSVISSNSHPKLPLSPLKIAV